MLQWATFRDWLVFKLNPCGKSRLKAIPGKLGATGKRSLPVCGGDRLRNKKSARHHHGQTLLARLKS